MVAYKPIRADFYVTSSLRELNFQNKKLTVTLSWFAAIAVIIRE